MYHPKSCYTSRKIDFSTKLNEILAQDNEVSDKILIVNDNNNDDGDYMSKSLGMYYKMKMFKAFYQIYLFMIIFYH